MTANTTPGLDRTRLLLAAGVGLLAVLVAIAFITTRDGGSAGDGDDLGVAVAGEPLPRLDDAAAVDPAVGSEIPNTAGTSISGETVNPSRNGEAKVILFVAHWCPVCQREVPAVQSWLDAGGLPEDVGLYAISTAETPSRDNADVEGWLEGEGWTVPTLRDVDDAAAEAYGVSGFPFWVFVDADDRVVARHSGELPSDALDAMVQQLAG